MKKIILYCCAVLGIISCKKNVDPSNTGFSTASLITAANVPPAVLSNFTADFSASTEREWWKKGDKFICQFNMNGQRHETEFEHDGHENSHSVICLEAALPQAVLNAFTTTFPNDLVYEWKLIADNNWKAHFMRGSVKHEVTISAAGEILKTEHD